ncbi:MAG: glycosyltransferase family 4 protein [Hyphomicrobiaceae bacterium]|nr:glycosyltransferase family 4 protein [Hyphomicrobiaceae bacterium]
MPDCAFLVPGDLALPTGGYTYDRRLLALLGSSGIDVAHIELPASFPSPMPADLARTAEIVANLNNASVLFIDGLAYGAMPVDLLRSFSKPIVALCHHPLGYEAGLAPERAAALIASEKAALAYADAVIVTSGETRASLVGDFDVPAARITVAEPGVDPAPRARGTGSPVQLLAVGSVVPRKAYGHLLSALEGLAQFDWSLAIVGADDRHPDEPRRLRQIIDDRSLAGRVTLAGAVDEVGLNRHYDAADVFVMTSLYEGYGMVLAEAMARGLPIVTSECGAAAARAPQTAALKSAPGDVLALRAALRRVIEDADLRQDMARASWVAGQQLPRWEETARTVAAVLRRIGA